VLRKVKKDRERKRDTKGQEKQEAKRKSRDTALSTKIGKYEMTH